MTASFTRRALSVEQARVEISEITGAICIWDGCRKTYEGNELPSGWRWLLTFWSQRPEVVLDFSNPTPGTRWHRDAVLCPNHVAALEALLKPLPDRRLDKPQGRS